MARLTKDEWGLQLAVDTARRSTCFLRAVGCVLVDLNGYVLATGYNGTPRGTPNCNEFERATGLRSKTRCPGDPVNNPLDCLSIHAEANALLQCSDVNMIETCYTTHRPCWHCVKLLSNTSCHRIVFIQDHEDKKPEEFWRRQKREWTSAIQITNMFFKRC